MALEPITRAEKIMSGESLEPITREEMFLAKAAGMDVNTPEPITRREMFLSKISGGSGGGSGGGDEWFNDGHTHIWIKLHEGRTSPALGVCPNGTVTVDWGDGTAPDTLTGTSVSDIKRTPPHEYAEPGNYVITLTVDGEMGFYLNEEGEGFILSPGADAPHMNHTYQSTIKKIEIGDNVTSIGAYAFADHYALASVTIPSSVTSIEESTFDNCCALASVNIPSSVTSIGSYAFARCFSLMSVTIPSSVTSINSGAFSSNKDAFRYDFSRHTEVPALRNSSAFQGISDDCEILVPAALYDEWITATNWAVYADYIVAV